MNPESRPYHSIVWSFPATAVLGALLCACATTLPADGAGAPDVRAGDTWTYNVIEENFADSEAKRFEYSLTRTVERVADREIEVSDDRVGCPSCKQKRKFDLTWGLIQAPGSDGRAIVFSPHRPALIFPLTAGRSWIENYTWQTQGETVWSDLQANGKVVGSEETHVPAGTFRTLEVELLTAVTFGPRKRAIFVQPKDRGGTQELYWYAPPIKNFVKYMIKVYKDRNLVAQTTWELANYRINAGVSVP